MSHDSSWPLPARPSEPRSFEAPTTWRWLLLGATVAVLSGLTVALGMDVGGFEAWVWTVMLGSILAGALVVASALALRGARLPRAGVWVGLALAVLFRLSLLPAERYLSDDAFRYLWDGKVLAHGINPYAHAPSSKELDALRTHRLDGLINHPAHRTVYPPLAQAYFAAGYLLSPGSLLGLQVLFVLSEVVSWLLLLGLLRRWGRSPAWVLLAAWAPLVVFEGYLPGHVDTLGLPWLVLLVVALDRRIGWLAGVALAAACLVKPLPVILLPVALVHLGWRRGLHLCAVLVAVVLLAYLPLLSAGDGLTESLWLMARKWSFNGSLAALLEASMPQATARMLAAGILSALLLAAPFLGRSLTSRLLLAQVACVVCTPNLYAWYAIWMLPLLVLRPDPALLSLALLLPLTEVVNVRWRMAGVWKVELWPSVVIYSVFYPLLAISAWMRWGAFAPAPERGSPSSLASGEQV